MRRPSIVDRRGPDRGSSVRDPRGRAVPGAARARGCRVGALVDASPRGRRGGRRNSAAGARRPVGPRGRRAHRHADVARPAGRGRRGVQPGDDRHDRNAVRVDLLGPDGPGKAGYLPADVAPAWRSPLLEIERQGAVAACRARVFRGGNTRGDFVVVLRLAPPERALALNTPPAGAALLEPERECAVTGENKHQDAIGTRLGPVWATLHAAQVESGASAGAQTLEVRIGGRRVGVLTAAQGARYASLLSRGDPVSCEAEVFHGRTAVEVRIFLPKVD
jgi:hypothetical protein